MFNQLQARYPRAVIAQTQPWLGPEETAPTLLHFEGVRFHLESSAPLGSEPDTRLRLLDGERVIAMGEAVLPLLDRIFGPS